MFLFFRRAKINLKELTDKMRVHHCVQDNKTFNEKSSIPNSTGILNYIIIKII